MGLCAASAHNLIRGEIAAKRLSQEVFDFTDVSVLDSATDDPW